MKMKTINFWIFLKVSFWFYHFRLTFFNYNINSQSFTQVIMIIRFIFIIDLCLLKSKLEILKEKCARLAQNQIVSTWSLSRPYSRFHGLLDCLVIGLWVRYLLGIRYLTISGLKRCVRYGPALADLPAVHAVLFYEPYALLSLAASARRTIHFLLDARKAASSQGVCNPCHAGVVTTAYFTGAINLTVDGSIKQRDSRYINAPLALDLYRIPGTSPQSLGRMLHNKQLRQMDSIWVHLSFCC